MTLPNYLILTLLWAHTFWNL